MTPGEAAYSRDLIARPVGAKGQLRKPWTELGAEITNEWEAHPFLAEPGYPCTLSDIAPTGGAVHLTAEYLGKRYALQATKTFHAAEKSAHGFVARNGVPGLSLFMTDRSDSTCIHGGPKELAKALQAASATSEL